MSIASLDGPAPAHAGTVDPEWLINVLSHSGVRAGDRLMGVRAQPLDAGVGAFSSLLRLELTYDAPSRDLPRSLVLKLPSTIAANRRRALAFDMYRREALFYRDVAPTLAVRVPRCYWSNADGDRGHGALLLEDLQGLSRGDQLAGISLAQARRAVQWVAAMHAQWWETHQLADLVWLPRLGGWTEDELVRAYRAQWPAFARTFASDLPPGSLEAGARLCDEMETLLHALSTSPRTLLHGDFRADNLFFSDHSRGSGVAVIDWQLSCSGRAVSDVAYLLCQSMSASARRRHEIEILRAWHDELGARGVTGYSFHDAVRDYARGVQLCVAYAVVGSALHREDDRAIALGRAQVQRSFAAALDLSGGGAFAVTR
jgi:aminoglycoside phosphotransferase (APT) family kinase protein